jgi:hypothetical protein
VSRKIRNPGDIIENNGKFRETVVQKRREINEKAKDPLVAPHPRQPFIEKEVLSPKN